MIDLKISLNTKQQLALKELETCSVLLYGGARGGGKSYFQRAVHVVNMITKQGYLGVIFRRHYRDLKTNHLYKMESEYPELMKYFRRGDLEWHIPEMNSRIMLRSIGEEGDLGKYKGAEFHGLGIDECDELPAEWIIRLRSSNRSSNPNIRPFTLLTGNPGGFSHHYLKRIFIDRKFEPNEKASEYKFVQALMTDNPALIDTDPDYINRVRAEPNEQVRRAWLEGAWDIEMGQYFSVWNPRVHVIEPLNPATDMKGWYKYGAMDWGWGHPCAFGWFAIDPETGRNIMYREYYGRKLNPYEVMHQLFKFEDTNELKYVAAGHDCWNRQRDGGPSVADQFQLGRPYRMNLFDPGSRDRIMGWTQLRAGLQWEGFEEKDGPITAPMLQFTSNCRLTIDSIPRMQHDRNKFEDCAKIECRETSPIGSGDDGPDMVRHAVMSRPAFNKYVPLKASRGRYNTSGEKQRAVAARERLGWNTI